MNAELRDKFISLWLQYFNNAELPITFQFSATSHDIPFVEPPDGHKCLITQLLKVRRGESVCMNDKSVSCIGGKRYMMFSDSMPPGFECYISHYPNGKGERYKSKPEQVRSFWENLPKLKIPGDNLIFKRWDKLEETDQPDAVIFFVNADILSGLFTLANFDSTAEDAVIAPFGAGCTNIIYYPYREQLNGTGRCVLGLLDPSARKCAKGNLLTFSVPMTKFNTMIGQMEESFLITDTWSVIQRRIE